MDLFNKAAKSISKYNLIGCVLFFILSYNYYKNRVNDFPDNFLIVVVGLFSFVAIFYSVVIVKQFLEKLKRANLDSITNLENEIRKLTKEESENLKKQEYDENYDLMNKKQEVYRELGSTKKREINGPLFFTAFLLIILIFVTLFPVEVLLNNLFYKVIILLAGFWIVIYQLVKILTIFYFVYAD